MQIAKPIAYAALTLTLIGGFMVAAARAAGDKAEHIMVAPDAVTWGAAPQARLLGIHINMPATVPPDIAKALQSGEPAPAGLSEQERAAFDALNTFYKKYRAYAVMMATRLQTIGYALTDSPAGLAAWIYDYNNGEPERLLTKDEMLDDITLYWLTNSATSAARHSDRSANRGRQP